jgi:hypothetical protein
MAFLQNHGILQQTIKKSVTLNATNQAILINESDVDDLLSGGVEFSISFWFKPNSALNTNGNLLSSINTAFGNDGWAIEVESTSILRVWAIDNFGSGNYLQVDFNHSMTANNWYHIVLTYDGSEEASGLALYINGVASTPTINVDGGFIGDIENNDNLEFGNGNFFSGDRQGVYDEITIWEDELTAGQVTTLYNSGIPSNPRTQLPSLSLRAWLRFDEDDLFFPTVRDSQGNVTATYVNIPQSNITTDVLE